MRLRNYKVWLPLLALALVVFGWRLNTVPLTNWDEGIYANVNLELLHSHDWTKLTYFGATFLEKPPLQFWMTEPLFAVFGPSELTLRFWSALAGVATVVLIGLWSWQATKNRTIAWLAGALFMFGRFALVHAFRTGDLDGLLTFLVVFALYSYWRSWDKPKWWLGWGIATALAVMTKSLVGLVPIIVAGLDVVFGWQWKKVSWKWFAWSLLALVVIAAPWHIIETMRFGHKFWDSYLGWNILDRTTESLFTKTPWYYYLQIIRDRFFPFSFLLLLALLVAARRWWRERSGLDRLLLLWMAVVLVLFTFIQTRREWYVLPLYPAAVILLARGIVDWWRNKQPRWMFALLIISIGGAFGHMLFDRHLQLILDHIPGVRSLPTHLQPTIPGQLLFGVISTVLLILVVWLLKKTRWSWQQWTIGLSGAAMFLMSAVWTVSYIRALPATLPLKTIATRVEQEHPTALSLIGTRLKKQPAGYFYLLRLPMVVTEYDPGTIPPTSLFLTTTEAKNAPLNTTGTVLMKISPLLLVRVQ